MLSLTTVRLESRECNSCVCAEGAGCTAFDVIVSRDVFEETKVIDGALRRCVMPKVRKGMREFLVELALSRVETKYEMELNRGTNHIYIYISTETVIYIYRYIYIYIDRDSYINIEDRQGQQEIDADRKIMGRLTAQNTLF